MKKNSMEVEDKMARKALERKCTACNAHAKGKKQVSVIFGFRDAAHTRPHSKCKACRKESRSKSKPSVMTKVKESIAKITKTRATKWTACPDGSSSDMVILTETQITDMLVAIKTAGAQKLGFNIKEV